MPTRQAQADKRDAEASQRGRVLAANVRTTPGSHVDSATRGAWFRRRAAASMPDVRQHGETLASRRAAGGAEGD